MAGKFESAVNKLLSLVAEGDSACWSMTALCDKVIAQSEWKNAGSVQQMIRALVMSGRFKGRLRGSKILDIEPGEKNGQSDDSLVTDLRSRLESVKGELHLTKKELEELRAVPKPESQPAAPSTILEVHLKDEKGKTKKITKGVFHAQFKRITQLAQARMNIFIYGPTGCGKTHICSQLAESLGLRFGFISCTAGMSEAQLTGRLLPVGKSGTFEYVVSEFVRCYEEGGVFLLDELDAADPNILLIVNAALANGHLAVPNRPEKPYAERHPDFICIAAANTVGTGADRLYSGRNKLDAATLDRFQIGKVMMDYDERVEKDLCPDDSLRNRLLRYRLAVRAHRLERAVSTRFMRDAYRMKSEFGWTEAMIDAALFEGWREDEVSKVKSY